MAEIKTLDPKNNIIIIGANQHNLKNISVAIPRNKFVVITGLSGSGKSSLAFDTLYAEGQRKYVESLSSYARQFMGKITKPKVDQIKGISPAIAIEQKINITNPRSTVGTKSEIYAYLKLLFARIGKTYSPITGKEIKKHKIIDVTNYIKKFKIGAKLMLISPILFKSNENKEKIIKSLVIKGFAKVYIDNRIIKISELKNFNFKKIDLLIERILNKKDNKYFERINDSIELAFYEGNGSCKIIDIENPSNEKLFSNFMNDGNNTYLTPSLHLFNFNNPYGACNKCQGYGETIGIDPDLVIPNKALSIYDEAILPWRGALGKKYYKTLLNNAINFNFPIHKPFYKLNESQIQILWEGNVYFKGLNHFFSKIESKIYKIQNRVLLSRYRGKTICEKCKGGRLRKEAEYVKINNKSIIDLVNLPVSDLIKFFANLNLKSYELEISKRLIDEIKNRLSYLDNVGLEYLTLNRKSNTLSGGESQRINIAASLGSSLIGSIYILDEPSIGLHSMDNKKLIEILIKLKNMGNTVVVVEHDEDIIRSADLIIDMGEKAGSKGGDVIAYGSLNDICKTKSLTAQYLKGLKTIPIPIKKNRNDKFILIKGARENNLKNINVKIPLNCLTIISGVSGSGKSTLVKKILYPALLRKLDVYSEKPGQFDSIEGDFNSIKNIEYVTQNPIGRSSRSNPVTYIKAYDDIRKLFANQNLSKIRDYKPKHFSFNVIGGRCENCLGEGTISIEMQFMADIILECDECQGKKFKNEIIEIQYNGYSIDKILKMTINKAIKFFKKHGELRISNKLIPLKNVGLGYILLGQSSSTLSGGEAQRIKLASFLAKGITKKKTLFIFDEPTTGLHFHDIKKLLKSFSSLISIGHTILVVEHNLDLIKCADHIIELGPFGGNKGGYIIAEGTPENISKNKKSNTGKFLKNKLIY
ncbi:MAG: excinuclease ABC subunit UvrA [Flavobacteriaceae bacterium]|nr:excinuclease ABC subunit UvrA [Flavobacteriaceae bacterium]